MASGRDLHRTKSFDGSGKCLGSTLYTLVVGPKELGPERKLFHCHEAVLSQSPVFERMCNGSFREGLKHHIELPDDDIHVFGYMLEYLYRGVFRGFETPNQDLKTVMLADLYIMAEKYQLQGLKTLLVTPLEALFDCPSKAEGIVCFFDAARKIYENIPDSEALFPDCFKKTVMYIVRFRDEQPYIEEQIKLCISDGGKLARDTFDAYSMQIHTQHKIHDSGVKTNAAALRAQLYTLYNLSRDLKAKKDALELKVRVLSATNSFITGYHGIHHGECRICCHFPPKAIDSYSPLSKQHE